MPELNSTFTSLIGEDINNQLVASILRKREGIPDRESPVEKIIKLKKEKKKLLIFTKKLFCPSSLFLRIRYSSNQITNPNKTPISLITFNSISLHM